VCHNPACDANEQRVQCHVGFGDIDVGMDLVDEICCPVCLGRCKETEPMRLSGLGCVWSAVGRLAGGGARQVLEGQSGDVGGCLQALNLAAWRALRLTISPRPGNCHQIIAQPGYSAGSVASNSACPDMEVETHPAARVHCEQAANVTVELTGRVTAAAAENEEEEQAQEQQQRHEREEQQEEDEESPVGSAMHRTSVEHRRSPVLADVGP
jgi:hypothetical protein